MKKTVCIFFILIIIVGSCNKTESIQSSNAYKSIDYSRRHLDELNKKIMVENNFAMEECILEYLKDVKTIDTLLIQMQFKIINEMGFSESELNELINNSNINIQVLPNKSHKEIMSSYKFLHLNSIGFENIEKNLFRLANEVQDLEVIFDKEFIELLRLQVKPYGVEYLRWSDANLYQVDLHQLMNNIAIVRLKLAIAMNMLITNYYLGTYSLNQDHIDH